MGETNPKSPNNELVALKIPEGAAMFLEPSSLLNKEIGAFSQTADKRRGLRESKERVSSPKTIPKSTAKTSQGET